MYVSFIKNEEHGLMKANDFELALCSIFENDMEDGVENPVIKCVNLDEKLYDYLTEDFTINPLFVKPEKC